MNGDQTENECAEQAQAGFRISAIGGDGHEDVVDEGAGDKWGEQLGARIQD